MTATCMGLGGVQERPSCEPRLAGTGAGPGAVQVGKVQGLAEAKCCLFERIQENLKHGPRQAIHMEKPFIWKQLGWARKLGGTEPQGITRVGQTVSQFDGVSDNGSHLALWFFAGRAQKRTVASALVMPHIFYKCLMVTSR